MTDYEDVSVVPSCEIERTKLTAATFFRFSSSLEMDSTSRRISSQALRRNKASLMIPMSLALECFSEVLTRFTTIAPIHTWQIHSPPIAHPAIVPVFDASEWVINRHFNELDYVQFTTPWLPQRLPYIACNVSFWILTIQTLSYKHDNDSQVSWVAHFDVLTLSFVSERYIVFDSNTFFM